MISKTNEFCHMPTKFYPSEDLVSILISIHVQKKYCYWAIAKFLINSVSKST